VVDLLGGGIIHHRVNLSPIGVIMEWILAAFAFAAPLIGFYPNPKVVGWTTYRDRIVILLSFVFLGWALINTFPFGLIFGLLLLRYKSSDNLHGVALWGCVVALWFITRSLPNKEILITSIILAGLGQTCFALVDASVMSYNKRVGKRYEPTQGSLGNRINLGAFLAIILPLVASWDTWYLFIPMFIGLILSTSRGAILGGIFGSVIAWPQVGFYLMPVFAVVWCFVWLKFVESALADSFRARLAIAELAIRYALRWPYWLVGYGFNSFNKKSLIWFTIYREKVSLHEGFAHVHNDYIQVFFEYGLVGLIALSSFAYSLAPYMSLGDPLTGCAVSIAIISFIMFPNHIAPIGVTNVILLALLSAR